MIAHVPTKRTQRYRLALIEDAHKRAIQRQTKKQEAETVITISEDPAPISTWDEPEIQPIKLTEMQIGILSKGISGAPFMLTKSETGKSSGQLMARGLIKPLRKGVYELLPKGRTAYEDVINGYIAALPPTEVLSDVVSGINLNDEALSDTEAARWQRIADERMKTLRKAESTIDELGRLIDEGNTEIKRLERVIDKRDGQIEALRREVGRLESARKDKAS